MAQEMVKEFFEKLKQDEELQNKVKAAARAYVGDKTDEKASFEAVIVPVAKEAGYEITFEEAMKLAAPPDHGKISDDDLDAVSGGKGDGRGMCIIIGYSNGESVKEAHACCYVGVGFGGE